MATEHCEINRGPYACRRYICSDLRQGFRRDLLVAATGVPIEASVTPEWLLARIQDVLVPLSPLNF
jgi:hypothetical protein